MILAEVTIYGNISGFTRMSGDDPAYGDEADSVSKFYPHERG